MPYYIDEILDQIQSECKQIHIQNDISDEDANLIAKMLKQVRIKAAENNRDPNLEEISIKKSKIDDAGLELITKELIFYKQLKIVLFESCFIQRKGAESIAELLRSNKSIVNFTFWRNCPTQECWHELVSSSRVIENECNSWIDIFAPVLVVNNTLKYMDLSCGSINDDAAVLLATGLASNTALERLDISYSKISEKNMRVICAAIDENKTLQSIGAKFCGDPVPHANRAGAIIYQFTQIASDTLENQAKCALFDDYKFFNELTLRKKHRISG